VGFLLYDIFIVMKIIKLTESYLTNIVKKVINEQSEHVKNLYKSWANKKSGNPEKAMSIMDDVIKYQKQLPKKDFASYSSYMELLGDLIKVKKSVNTEDVTKIYEDKDLLVMAANTHDASCKYGAGTKWCTTAKDTDSYWRRHNQTGTEFFWIFKNKPQSDPNHKLSYHIKLSGEPDWCNAINDCKSSKKLPEDSYPKQHPKYNDIIQKLQEYHNNRNFSEFKNVGDDLENHTQEVIQTWVEDNYDELFEDIFKGKIINTVRKEVIDNFYNQGLDYDFTPNYINNKDDEEKYNHDLMSEVSKFNPKVQIYGIDENLVEQLTWLINDLIEDPITFLGEHTPEQLIYELYDVDSVAISEVLKEYLYEEFQYQLELFIEEFNGKYYEYYYT